MSRNLKTMLGQAATAKLEKRFGEILAEIKKTNKILKEILDALKPQ